jgi:hypothetical protein
MLTAQYRGQRFLLELNDAGEPRCLKRQARADDGRWYWTIVWGDWHKRLPTGIHQRAINAMGFKCDHSKHRWIKTGAPPNWQA